MDENSLLWGRAHKLYGKLASVLEGKAGVLLRAAYHDDERHGERQLVKLNSCSGKVSGKWLQSFPCSWWPKMTDDIFIMAIKFRSGIRICEGLNQCMHCSCKVEKDVVKTPCGKDLDPHGDHAVNCPIGGHFFTRHTSLNDVLVQAGRAAGYQVLIEQVVPDFARWKRKEDGTQSLEEARVDVELFGHPVVLARYLDGTIRHPITSSSVSLRVFVGC